MWFDENFSSVFDSTFFFEKSQKSRETLFSYVFSFRTFSKTWFLFFWKMNPLLCLLRQSRNRRETSCISKNPKNTADSLGDFQSSYKGTAPLFQVPFRPVSSLRSVRQNEKSNLDLSLHFLGRKCAGTSKLFSSSWCEKLHLRSYESDGISCHGLLSTQTRYSNRTQSQEIDWKVVKNCLKNAWTKR